MRDCKYEGCLFNCVYCSFFSALCCMAECQVKQNKQMDALALFQESSEIINKSMGVEHPVRGRSNSLPRVIFRFVLTVECLFVFSCIRCCSNPSRSTEVGRSGKQPEGKCQYFVRESRVTSHNKCRCVVT